MSSLVYQVPDDIWKDFQRIQSGKTDIMEWWKYVRMIIQDREAKIMYATSWLPRY